MMREADQASVRMVAGDLALFDRIHRWLGQQSRLRVAGFIFEPPGFAFSSLQTIAVAPLEGIYDPEALNVFLHEQVITPINQTFGVTPANPIDAHRYLDGGMTYAGVGYDEIVAEQEVVHSTDLRLLRPSALKRIMIDKPYSVKRELIERTLIRLFPHPYVAALVLHLKRGSMYGTVERYGRDMYFVDNWLTEEQLVALRETGTFATLPRLPAG